MSRCSDGGRRCVVGAALALATLLSACSTIYYDRRETVAFGAADAVATDRIVQTIDPWPPLAANRRLTYDGAVAAAAVERYRTGRVIQPRGTGTSSAPYVLPPPQQAPTAANAPAATP